METINEFKISLKGTANIPKKLLLEKDVDMSIKNAETVSSKDTPNGDGTIDRTFTIRITERSEITILAENEIIQAKKKGSQSQKLRAEIFKYWSQQLSGEIEFDDYYKTEMTILINKYNQKLI